MLLRFNIIFFIFYETNNKKIFEYILLIIISSLISVKLNNFLKYKIRLKIDIYITGINIILK